MEQVPVIEEITLAADPEPWLAAGFDVVDGRTRLGTSTILLAGSGAGRGMTAWTLSGVSSPELDGLPTRVAPERTPDGPAPGHPNGVIRIDHVVAFSPRLERTIGALETAGLDFRRLREGPTPAGAQRQAFFRLGETILEVVDHPPDSRAAADAEAASHFYGLALLVEDMDAAREAMGTKLGQVRDAVQPGRRIATVSRDAGLGLPVALMSPAPGRAGQAEELTGSPSATSLRSTASSSCAA